MIQHKVIRADHPAWEHCFDCGQGDEHLHEIEDDDFYTLLCDDCYEKHLCSECREWIHKDEDQVWTATHHRHLSCHQMATQRAQGWKQVSLTLEDE